MRKTSLLLLSSFASAGLMMSALCCDKPKQTPQDQADTTPAPKPTPAAPASGGPMMPASHLRSEIIQPTQNYKPDSFPTIADLPVGESGWIRPWSMWNTVDGDFFINTSHSYRTTKAEKDWIKVTRQHRGFDVELDHTPFEWSAIDTKYPKEGSGENLPVLSISE